MANDFFNSRNFQFYKHHLMETKGSMKKYLLTAAGILVSIQANATSNVTVYGIVDSAITHVSNKNGASSTELNSGNLNTSRIGFRGNEDLGNGLSAIFNLEAGTAIDVGTIGSSTAFWNRQSWMGLESKFLGTFKLGFQRPVFYDLLGPLSHTPPFGSPAARIDGAGISGSTLAKFNNTIGTTRYANSLKYSTPDFSGFKLHAFTAFGEVEGTAKAGSTLNVGAGYKNKKLTLGISYLMTECKGSNGCTVLQERDKVWGVGAGYSFDKLRVTGIYTQQKNARNVSGQDADTYSVALMYPINKFNFSLGYQQLNDKTSLDQDVTQINFSGVYNLSKRTALYTILARQTVKNNGIAGISFLSSNEQQFQASFGLRHRF